MVRFAFVAAVLALVACNTDFDPQYRVTELRILAVRAQSETTGKADFRPDESLRLEALVANPRGDALTVTWFVCPPSLNGWTTACDEDDFRRDPLGLWQTPPYAGRVLLFSQDNPAILALPALGIEAQGAVSAALSTLVDFALRDPTAACTLYAAIPLVLVAEAGGRREVAFKKVRLLPTDADKASLTEEQKSAYEANTNPLISAVVADPTDRDACLGDPIGPGPLPEGSSVLFGCYTASAADNVSQCIADPGQADGLSITSFPESLSWQWYVTAGTFPQVGGQGNAVGQSVDFVPPTDPVPEYSIWTILRDGRGGVDWSLHTVAGTP